jgi:hypothetical protein
MKFHGSASLSSLSPAILLLVLIADQTHRCVLAQDYRGIGLITPTPTQTEANFANSSEAPSFFDDDGADIDPTSTIILEPVISDDNNETIASEPEPATLAPAESNETITLEPQPVPVDPTENNESIDSEPEPATLAPAESNDTNGRTPPKPPKEEQDPSNIEAGSSSGGHPSPNSRERGYLVWQLGSIGIMTLVLLFGV